MLPADLAELGDWVVRHKMHTKSIELELGALAFWLVCAYPDP